jgi:hypothetical protein
MLDVTGSIVIVFHGESYGRMKSKQKCRKFTWGLFFARESIGFAQSDWLIKIFHSTGDVSNSTHHSPGNGPSLFSCISKSQPIRKIACNLYRSIIEGSSSSMQVLLCRDHRVNDKTSHSFCMVPALIFHQIRGEIESCGEENSITEYSY